MGINYKDIHTLTSLNTSLLRAEYSPKRTENKEVYIVTNTKYDPSEGVYTISVETNDVKLLRQDLAKLQVHFHQTRESEY